MPIIETMVNEISQFLNVSHDEAFRRVEEEIFNPGVNVAKAWKEINPVTEEEIVDFYRKTDAYIFDLYVDHQRAFRRKLVEKILFRLKSHNANIVLDYGGGLGFDAIAMREKNMDVTYFELEGLTSKFAEERFKKKGYSDAKVIKDSNKLEKNFFDAIVCIEVLEHVPNPIKLVKLLFALLKVNGIILLTESFGGVGDEYPSHLKTNQKYAGRIFKLMESYGLICTYRYFGNAPLEFKKVKKDFKFLLFKIKWRWVEFLTLFRKTLNIIRRSIWY